MTNTQYVASTNRGEVRWLGVRLACLHCVGGEGAADLQGLLVIQSDLVVLLCDLLNEVTSVECIQQSTHLWSKRLNLRFHSECTHKRAHINVHTHRLTTTTLLDASKTWMVG